MSPIEAPPSQEVQNTARRIVALFEGQPASLLTYLVGQVSTLRSQAQSMMGLCGLIITVTGFSGPRMVQAASFSAYAMVAGIALCFVGAVLSLRVMIRIRWVSRDLHDDLTVTVVRVIHQRDILQRRMTVAGGFVAGGLAAYLVAVAAAAFQGDPLNGG